MDNIIKIERRKDHIGRALFVVGNISTHDEKEAEALSDETINEILCPFAREISESGIRLCPRVESLMPAPNGHGVLDKFDWE